LTNTACFTQQAQSPPAKPAPPPLEFLGEWGTRGKGAGLLAEPSHLAADPYGNVFITDLGQAVIQKFTADGHPLLSFGDPLLKSPWSIALDSGGGIYVVDDLRKSIFIFAPEGQRLREIRARGGRVFDNPTDVVVDDAGTLFVTEHYGGSIHRISALGRREKSWGSWRLENMQPGEFRHVLAIAVDASGFVYIADVNNSRVQKFTRDGEYILHWPLETAPQPLRDWCDLAVFRDYVLILDASPPGTLQVWSKDGQAARNISLEGRLHDWRGSNAKSIPHMTVNKRGDLFILDTSTRRVLRFRINF